jgi:hypothetical protein
MKKKNKRVLVDLALVVVSVVVAILIVRTGTVHTLTASLYDLNFFGSFLAGMLFTSVFTTAPAIAILGELSQTNSIAGVVLFGALGAMVGDYLIFRFVRDRISRDFAYLTRGSKALRVPALLKSGVFRFVTPLIGALIIASPFPDELGLTMLGFSKIKPRTFFLISFTFNALGILGIAWVANSTMW